MSETAEDQPGTGNRSPFLVHNVRLFITFRILFNARFYYPVFTILFLDYGLSVEQFALLNAVWAITIVCAEIPSGALADLIGRKRLLVVTALLMVCEMSLLAFIPLGRVHVVFYAFLINRVLSGLAEAMASGADEAIAYDSLLEQGSSDQWPVVLGRLMRLQAIAGVLAMTIGALVYDPETVNSALRFFGIDLVLSQQITMRFPVYLTLILALFAVLVTSRLQENKTSEHLSRDTVGNILHLTLQAGSWILKTPFALAVILFGMLFDHLLRLVITLASQYFRLISLPEASFGVIMASLSLLGLIVPRGAQWLVDRCGPLINFSLLALLLLATLIGLQGFFPYLGILPMAGVMIGLLLTSFLTSHYLNQAAPSAHRATILSFKGMLFNLAYGLIGVFFAIMIGNLRSGLSGSSPPELLEDTAFRLSFRWLFGYGLTLVLIIGTIAYRWIPRQHASPAER